jgi:ATP-dependent Zn protease
MASKGGAQLAATAFHEAGHAFMAWRQGVPVYKATIIPGDDTLGHVRHGKSFLRAMGKTWR